MSGIPLLWKLSGDPRDLKRDITANAKLAENNCHSILQIEKGQTGTDSRMTTLSGTVDQLLEAWADGRIDLANLREMSPA